MLHFGKIDHFQSGCKIVFWVTFAQRKDWKIEMNSWWFLKFWVLRDVTYWKNWPFSKWMQNHFLGDFYREKRLENWNVLLVIFENLSFKRCYMLSAGSQNKHPLIAICLSYQRMLILSFYYFVAWLGRYRYINQKHVFIK